MIYSLHHLLSKLEGHCLFLFLLVISIHTLFSTSFISNLSRDYHLNVVAYKPSSQALDPDTYFSACLLVKDDNEKLSEWVAYHYHVLRLRRLVVAVDPASDESPHEILERYSKLTDLEVLLWNDADYMSQEFLRKHSPPSTFLRKSSTDGHISHEKMREVGAHRYRQSAFYAACMREMKIRGSSWVVHVDTDEFLTASNPFSELPESDPQSTANLPTEGSVLKQLQSDLRENKLKYPCHSVFRIPYSSVESTDVERNNQVPLEFDAKQFETLRWRHHNVPEKMLLFEHYPKIIIDVSVLPSDRLSPHVVSSIHRPFWEICRPIQDPAESPALYKQQSVVANHYIGDWESYSSKKDNRRTGATYDSRSTVSEGVHDGARLWLQDFKTAMGFDKAVTLLGGEYLKHSTASIQVE